MGWSTILNLILFILIVIFGYILLSLNTSIVKVDLLFYEAEVSLGLILLAFFITGFFITIFFEILYFLSKKKSDE
tara:strand:+ start:218 stop:442 length:225 start_codon:yes stop_codon:yes gene_type:complete